MCQSIKQAMFFYSVRGSGRVQEFDLRSHDITRITSLQDTYSAAFTRTSLMFRLASNVFQTIFSKGDDDTPTYVKQWPGNRHRPFVPFCVIPCSTARKEGTSDSRPSPDRGRTPGPYRWSASSISQRAGSPTLPVSPGRTRWCVQRLLKNARQHLRRQRSCEDG